MEAFEIFSQGEDLESCVDLSWCDLMEKFEDLSEFQPDTCALVRVVLDVTDLLVFPSSVVTEFCEVFSCCSDCEEVVPHSLFLTRAHCCTSTQEGMRYESPPVKAPPLSRRRMMPPALLQNSNETFEGEQELLGTEDQMWRAKE